MSFINVTFGYHQSKVFNIQCEIAPLLDAIHQEAYKQMKSKLTIREEFFNKEIASFKKEQWQLEKKLEKLDLPPEQPKKESVKAKDKGRKKTKKELEAEEAESKRLAEEEEKLRLLKEEEERKRLEEEERKKKEEEEAAKKKGGKDKKKGKGEEEVVEVPVEETEE